MRLAVVLSVILVLAVLAASTAEVQASPGPEDRPNIVYILADDLGYGDLSCLNWKSKIATPHLDRLAAEGVIATDAHAGSSVCTPSRYGILTGRYCWRGRLQKGVLGPWEEALLEPGRLTVPALLKRSGYHTACIGKWHLGMQWQATDGKPPRRGGQVDFNRPIANGPTTRGFDYYFGTDVPNYPPYCFLENDHTVGKPTAQKPKEMYGNFPGPMLPGWKLEEILPTLTEKAVDYIGQRAADRAPFFLYFALTAPHTPLAPAKEFLGRSPLGKYGDFVQQVDDTVGRVLAALEKHGLKKNTLVLFTSDNGCAPYIGFLRADDPQHHGRIRDLEERGHHPSFVFRGYKSDIYEGGHRMPFLARWPGRIKPGTVCKETICLTDLMATCAAMLKVPLPVDAGEDSFNILPALLGQKSPTPIRAATVHHSIDGLFAIRQGPWKLILGKGSGGWSRPRSSDNDAPGQLYDLVEDPSEEKNVYVEHPDIVKRLTALLTKYRTEGRSRPK